MAGKKKSHFFETKYFGLVIGILFILIFLLINQVTSIFDRLEETLLDIHFNYKSVFHREEIQEGVTVSDQNININSDILIIGIDLKSLDKFGRWPFPRFREADLVNNFTRIDPEQPENRENSLFLDIFFVEPSQKAYNDVILLDSIKDSGRVFLETMLDEDLPPAGSEEEFYSRQRILYENYGQIKNISGNTELMTAYIGAEAPLQPYGEALYGYGHANFDEDRDKTYRRQALVARASELIETIPFDELSVDTELNQENFERFAWLDDVGVYHPIAYPLTEKELIKTLRDLEANASLRKEDTDNDGETDREYYVIRKFKDYFTPAITLSLALNYMNKTLDDVEVVLGEYILINNPEKFNTNTNEWEPYSIITEKAVYDADENLVSEAVYEYPTEIKIPIDEQGKMLINFMGAPSDATQSGYQTFPIRSFYGYAANPTGPDPADWRSTKGVENKILMVGPFARGMAADQKPTPFGLMYGIEIHANSLNTILTDNFISYAPFWMNLAVMAVCMLLTAFVTSRLSTVWAFVITLFLELAGFFTVSTIFEFNNIIVTYSIPAIGMIFTFIGVIVYRVMTEEKDKRRIKDMFGKYVSSTVVDQILENPPELGGVDKDLTVLFSDIRGFTTLSETMSPQELVNHLNLYLTAMTDIIMDYKGTLDKYVGDEIMCFWGAPLPQEEHAQLACRCALKQMEVLHKMNEEWPEERRINIGIGLNSGIMTVGNMGSLGRMNYTLMGDNVNLGARLEGTNKQYITNIIISEFTYGLVKDSVIVRELDNIRVKGKNKPVLIYELVDYVGGYDLTEEELAITGKSSGKSAS